MPELSIQEEREEWRKLFVSITADRDRLHTALTHCLERATILDPFTMKEAQDALGLSQKEKS